jgi:glycosyltransferase 2 family protein
LKTRYFSTVLKIALPLAIIVWLVASLDRDQLRQLGEHPIRWPLLACGFFLAMFSVCATFVRWYLLVRALDLPFRLADAFRLSFVGYLLNFVAFGSVGGDLFKAVFLAREQPGRRTEAVATVFIDRAVGLYSLLVVASVAILCSDQSGWDADIKVICNLTLAATLAGTAAIAVVLLPGWDRSSPMKAVYGLPKVGTVVHRLAKALDVYRGKRRLLALIASLSVTVHVVFAIALYLASAAIFPEHPTLADHFIIVPLSLVAGALPLAPAGLGTFEAAMRILYRVVPVHPGGDGFLVALVFRLITIVIAAAGVGYYWIGRREVGELLREAEREQDEDVLDAPLDGSEPDQPG